MFPPATDREETSMPPTSSLLATPTEEDPVQTPHIGKKVIVRAYGSGVHFGTLVAQDGQQVELALARRLWRWHTGGAGRASS
jgi:hypothetical protein